MEQKMNIKAAILSFISFYTFLFVPLIPLWAQEGKNPLDSDLTPPLILHRPPIQSVRPGGPLVIQATITDNVAVKKASVFFRFMGTREYFIMDMHHVGNNIYSIEIPDQYVQVPGLEYYIQASDKAGNIEAFRGSSFSPLTIKVIPISPSAKSWYQKWWVWTIVGGMVAAAAVAAGGGGGGGGGDGGSGPSDTGTAVINEPIP
jgi:hypothetical protein